MAEARARGTEDPGERSRDVPDHGSREGATRSVPCRDENACERRVAAERALQRERALLDSITRATDVMLAYLDTGFELVWVNDAYVAGARRPREELVGRNHFALYPQAENEAIFRRVRDTGEPAFEKDRPFVFPDQPERGVTYWDWSLVAVRDAAGAVAGLVYSLRETTPWKAAQDALREADRRKDEFLGMLSHELRNPLAPIRNSVYILDRADPLGPQAARARAVIRRQTEHLTRLVDDLLDVTRIARGKIELRPERLELGELLRQTADDLRAVIEDRGVSFAVETPAEALWVDADATRVAQVVGNLLHNAAKFTRAGDAVALALHAAGDRAEIQVRDTGAGIEAALLPSVFEPFVQADRTLARTEGGLGLGLALVRGIAELHGGTARAESAGRGRGATFVVTLPLAAAAVAPSPPERPLAPGGRPPRRVLVVDDNADAAETLADLVTSFGHRAEVALDGPSALAMARAHPPDAVLCDLGLPGLSGHEVAAALRASLGPGVLLVAVSGYAMPEDLAASARSGFDRHLAKPTDADELERLLGR